MYSLNVNLFNREFHNFLRRDFSERVPVSHMLLMNPNKYRRLIKQMEKVKTCFQGSTKPYFIFEQLTQYIKEFPCRSSTIFLAKIYLDRYLLNHPSFSDSQLFFLSVTCSHLAIRTNQPATSLISTISNRFDPAFRQILLIYEHRLKQTLNYQFSYMTPYNYEIIMRAYLSGAPEELWHDVKTAVDSCQRKVIWVNWPVGVLYLGALLYVADEFEMVNQVEKLLQLCRVLPQINLIADGIADNDSSDDEAEEEQSQMEGGCCQGTESL